MLDQYFGVKELYEVVLRARTPMQFGNRYIQAQQPVLYFENINMSVLQERSAPIMARGGWSNLPQVIWEDRSEVHFTLSEGVMSSVSMGILLSANVTSPAQEDKPLLVSKREGPFDLDDDHCIFLQHWPAPLEDKKVFIFQYERNVAQKKMYGKYIYTHPDPFDPDKKRPCIQIYTDKELQNLADINKEYIVDYYYEYGDEALIYTIQKQRFNGLFTLEGKFYSKDENDGINYTNLIYMPRVRVVSDINLRLGERADPTMSVFNIIAMPEHVDNTKKSLVLQITRLEQDLNDDF